MTPHAANSAGSLCSPCTCCRPCPTLVSTLSSRSRRRTTITSSTACSATIPTRSSTGRSRCRPNPAGASRSSQSGRRGRAIKRASEPRHRFLRMTSRPSERLRQPQPSTQSLSNAKADNNAGTGCRQVWDQCRSIYFSSEYRVSYRKQTPKQTISIIFETRDRPTRWVSYHTGFDGSHRSRDRSSVGLAAERNGSCAEASSGASGTGDSSAAKIRRRGIRDLLGAHGASELRGRFPQCMQVCDRAARTVVSLSPIARCDIVSVCIFNCGGRSIL